MKRAIVILMAIMLLLLPACVQPTAETEIVTRVVKETVVVTQPPQPTYTPYPTYTPLPTLPPQEPLPTYTPPPTPTTVSLPTDTPAPTPTWTPVPQPTATPTPTNTPTAVMTGWRGEYYDNRSLSDAPVLVRSDATVDFSWANSAPAAGLPADGFSARWTRDVEFDMGTYRFHILVDDGVRLYVDGDLLINAWYDGRFHEVTVDSALAGGTHSLEVEYFEHTGDALVRLWWEKISTPSFPDWKAEYWPNQDLGGFPVLVRNERQIDHYWGIYAPAHGLPADNFSARWSREAYFEDRIYNFYAAADDGILVYIDGDLVLGQWHDSSADEMYLFSRDLVGKHQLVVEYYEGTGTAQVRFWWELTGLK